MKTTPKKQGRWAAIRCAIVALLALYPSLCALADWRDNWEWGDTWGEATCECEACGTTYQIYGAEDASDAESQFEEFFCDDCGYCSESGNPDCYREHHCQFCSNCIENGEYHDGALEKFDEYICYDCWDEYLAGESDDVCQYCHEIFGAGVVECDCEYSMIEKHCTDCSELQCDKCGICMVIGGDETEAVQGDACLDHAICNPCMEDAAAEDLIHCRQCFMCDEDVCDECGLCESCAAWEEHCPECGFCFGNEVEWCLMGGEHCIHCCEDNEWLCNECGRCADGAGLEICSDCELCEECCYAKSESEGCEHGYCIASADYEDHLCPECGQCPQDEECEYCGLCPDCQADYHCEHELCPDGSDWDDHVCPDCGECFELDELCELCGLCEDCNEHCEHGVCPMDDDEGDHFICEQCGDCYDAGRCEYCELCEDCCRDNTVSMGCDHDFCIESDDFAEHWCYEDDQCLELCQHNPDCEHQHISTTWSMDATAHWHFCEDCGIALNKSIHIEGDPVTLTAANPTTHTNGTARISCAACNTQMGIISIPYVEVPADGKPYILIQPTDYTGKTDVTAYVYDVPLRYTTFKVKAGGANLSYQWYKRYGGGYRAITDDTPDEDGFYQHAGAQTATLKAYVSTDACDEDAQQYNKYYCVISNENGSVTSDIVTIKAQHVFGYYMAKDSETHENHCFGECDAVKNVSRHRFTEWTLVKAATSDETGLREQSCLDCKYKHTEVIPKVEPGHVHSFDIAKNSITQHWFVCKCGLSDPNGATDHVFDETEVVTEPTETRVGKNNLICSACGFSKTEKTDKLPHEHDWYSWDDPDMFVWGTNGRLVANQSMGSRGPELHTVRCKGCDQKKTERHVWPMWECTRDAKIQGNDTIVGKIVRYCEMCGYSEQKLYPYSSWPIMIAGGKAFKGLTNAAGKVIRWVPAAYAKKGDQIQVVYDALAARSLGFNNQPQKFVQWTDGTGYTGETNIPWDNGRSSIDLPRITFRFNRTTRQYGFTMPDGPATVFAVTEDCNHTGGTKQGERVEPTCGGYGHEPNTLCADCEEVLEEGARIPALGHDLPSTPIAGTEKVEYCTIYFAQGFQNYPNDTKYGSKGDFLCNRCGETVKGERTPLIHGLHDKTRVYSPNPGKTWTDYQRWEPSTNPPTCTKAGYDDDLYCKYCNKRVIKGERSEALDHEWGEWQVIREATTKIKGMEQRICERDETHVETRLTDYSGPDYTLQPNKTKVKLEWTYGEQPATQTVTFRSTGRNEVLAVVGAEESTIGGALNFSYDGMKLTIAPNMEYIWDMADGVQLTAELWKVQADEGETGNFTAPIIDVSCNVKKTPEKYTLNIIDGYATPVNERLQATANRKGTLQLRGGDRFGLEPLDELKDEFLCWEISDDASGLLSRYLYTDQPWAYWFMSPNNVTIRAIYLTPGNLFVSGTQVTKANKDNILGDGTVTYVPETNTLTLTNANITAAEAGGIAAKSADLTIVLNGENTITGSEYQNGMTLRTTGEGAVTFTGNGSLRIKAGNLGIETWHDIVLKDGAWLTIESTTDGGLQGRRAKGNPLPTLTMSGRETILEAKGRSRSLSGFHALNLSDGIELLEPATGAKIVEDQGVVSTTSSIYIHDWVILANRDYITGIEAIQNSKLKTQNEQRFNLSGQRVGEGYKGIVVSNGKKVLVK